MEAREVEHHDRQIVGTNHYTDTANSNIIVIAAGVPRQLGMGGILDSARFQTFIAMELGVSIVKE